MALRETRQGDGYRSESPCHLETRSLELTLKNVLFASVATAFARYDLPVPGGPYSRIPLHGVRLPVNRCGNLMGRMTASFNEALAVSRPATSSHLTLGFSERIAPRSESLSFFASGSPSSSFLHKVDPHQRPPVFAVNSGLTSCRHSRQWARRQR